jgi:hypothetical protein
VEVPVEKIVYRDRVVPVEKIVEVKTVREVPVPVEKVVEMMAFKKTFLEIPVERLVYRDRDVPIERVVEQIILQASFAAPLRLHNSHRLTLRASIQAHREISSNDRLTARVTKALALPSPNTLPGYLDAGLPGCLASWTPAAACKPC